MRYRYKFEDGKHLVKARDDEQNWVERETQEYPTAEAAQAAARDLDAKGEAPKAKPKNDMSTKAGVKAEFAEADKKGSGDRKDWDYDPHDFTVIPGVGERIAERLREGGITTLKMLARVSEARAEELGIKEDWIAEAKKLTAE